jgi:hypothetical protein
MSSLGRVEELYTQAMEAFRGYAGLDAPLQDSVIEDGDL